MITGYDPDKKLLTTGIGDLIELGRLPDSLVPSENAVSLQERQRIHGAYQRRMEKEGWEREVQVELGLERQGMRFLIRGRIDLLRRTGEPDEIIEVKTAAGGPGPLDPVLSRSRDVLQLYFYAMALAGGDKDGLERLRASLVYLDPRTRRGSVSETVISLDLADRRLRTIWNGMLDDTARMLALEDERKEVQVHALESFVFPYPVMRPGQQLMVDHVEKCVHQGGRLLMQAPTGTGKTAAILTGALRRALPGRLAVFFLTAKNTHKAIVSETLRLIMEGGVPLRAISIASRSSVCHMGRERCLPHDCPYAIDFGGRVRGSGVMERLLDGGIISTASLVEASAEAGVCAFELGLCLSTRCDLVICDYNYAFDPHVFLRRFFLERTTASRCLLLIDEAANLPARARDFHSPEVRLSWVEGMLEDPDRRAAWRRLLSPWTACFREWSSLLDSAGEPETELPHGTEVPSDTDRWLDIIGGLPEPTEHMINLVRSLVDFSRIDPDDRRYHLLIRREQEDTVLQWFCADPSAMLGERIAACSSTVAFSATMSPLEHFGGMLGFPEDADTVDVPYPFPPENLGVWICPGMDTRYRNRDRYAPALSRMIAGLRDSVPGSWLVFFPSYGYSERIAGLLSSRGVPFLVQEPGMKEAERVEFISRLEDEDVLALMVSGGIFSEGVDIRSDRLRGAVVVGPSLPGVDLRSRLLSEDFERRGMDGFLHTWAIPGMVRVVQAAGRLVRNSAQRRVLVLVGRRFTIQPYLGLLPKYWFSSGAIRLLKEDMSDIAGFF
ncbi:MAG: hypothetical protein AVO35_03590 [Candidatus Aegiribacteria sp. MLS_C]|nr:MAG: hypothetical protein AVO35_03590 [Candidatus Aegiribacteria sp. MLS_C]